VAESVLSCTSPSSNLRKNPEIRAGRVVRWWASSTPTYPTIQPVTILNVCSWGGGGGGGGGDKLVDDVYWSKIVILTIYYTILCLSLPSEH